MSFIKLHDPKFKKDLVDDGQPLPSFDDMEVSDVEVMTDHMLQLATFEEANKQFNLIVGACFKKLSNNFLSANIKTEATKKLVAVGESMEVHMESWQESIIRIIKAIIEFVKKTYNWFLSFKRVVNVYFSTNHKKLLDHIAWWNQFENEVRNRGIDNVLDIEKLKKESIIWNLRKDGVYGCDELEQVLANIAEYVDDPEGNNRDRISNMESSSSPTSFRSFLGVTIASNHNQPLAEPRIMAEDPKRYYRTEKGLTYDILGLHDLSTMVRVGIDIHKLEKTIKSSDELQRIFYNIEQAYEIMGEGINKTQKDPTFLDSAVAVPQAHAWTQAKHHVTKSKALLEAFIRVADIELKQRFVLLDQIRKHCVVPIHYNV